MNNPIKKCGKDLIRHLVKDTQVAYKQMKRYLLEEPILAAFPLPRYLTLLFQPGSGRIAPTKKGREEKGLSAINEVVIREYTINIYKCIHGVYFKKHATSRHLKRSGYLPWQGWELQMCTMTSGSTKLSGAKEKGMFNTISRCSCPENVMRKKIPKINSICWEPMYLSPI